ncbi:MAG: acylphosphatase [Burkholderiales bacterium]
MTNHLQIIGRVQGVGFRNYLEYKAREIGISGWVRNRRDGSVEAVISGERAAVEAMIDCARRGPRVATVTEVRISPANGEFSGFEVRPTT